MAFAEREFQVEDFPTYRALLGAGEKERLYKPHGWFVDEAREINFFEMGGRGEMPASTGAPPDACILVIGSLVYRVNLRRNVVDGRSGGAIYNILVESIAFPLGNQLTKEEVVSLLREALFASKEAIWRSVNPASFVEDIIIES